MAAVIAEIWPIELWRGGSPLAKSQAKLFIGIMNSREERHFMLILKPMMQLPDWRVKYAREESVLIKQAMETRAAAEESFQNKLDQCKL